RTPPLTARRPRQVSAPTGHWTVREGTSRCAASWPRAGERWTSPGTSTTGWGAAAISHLAALGVAERVTVEVTVTRIAARHDAA
ncbi:hypothetical protein ACFP2V_21325, partial [Streptomyces incanus]